MASLARISMAGRCGSRLCQNDRFLPTSPLVLPFLLQDLRVEIAASTPALMLSSYNEKKDQDYELVLVPTCIWHRRICEGKAYVASAIVFKVFTKGQ